MISETETQLAARLEALIAAEREALLAGDTAALTALLPQKEKLIADYGAVASRAGLEAMQAKVLRNQALLDQAMAGLKAAAKRLAELRRAREGLQTYDQTGRKQALGPACKQKLERRA